MLLSFVYLAFSALLQLLMGGRRSEFTKDVELLVLRHQLLLLGRQQRRPSFRAADRAFLAALSRMLQPRCRHGLIVTPQTLLRRHRELVRRRWTQRASDRRSAAGRASRSRARPDAWRGRPQSSRSRPAPVAEERKDEMGPAARSEGGPSNRNWYTRTRDYQISSRPASRI